MHLIRMMAKSEVFDSTGTLEKYKYFTFDKW
jgi:hypothetical protein